MPRRPRVAQAGCPLHVLSPSAGRIRMFRTDADFEAFQRLIVQAHAPVPIPILSWCLMGNHWHFVVDRPSDWLRLVSAPMTPKEREALKPSFDRGRLSGDPRWVRSMVNRLGLGQTVRRNGRPANAIDGGET